MENKLLPYLGSKEEFVLVYLNANNEWSIREAPDYRITDDTIEVEMKLVPKRFIWLYTEGQFSKAELLTLCSSLMLHTQQIQAKFLLYQHEEDNNKVIQ